MLQRLLLLLAAALFYTFQIQAQVFEPGVLVRANGDTLRGEIENGFWVEPPAFIRFRSAPEGSSQTFRPHQLRAVSFAKGRYFRYEGLPIDHAAETRLSELPRGNHPVIRTDSVLAEVLVEGSGTLLRVVLPGAAHFIIRCPNQPPLDLAARNYLRPDSQGHWVIADGNNYLDLLRVYFLGCAAATGVARTAAFTAHDLAAVVQAYNEACGTARQAGRNWLAPADTKRRAALLGGVLVGGRYNRIENESRYAPSTACSDCQAHPFVGLYAELTQPSRTVALYGELSLSPFRGQGTLLVSSGTATTDNVYNDFSYKAWLTTARLGVRYFFPLPHGQQWFLTAGYELNFTSGTVITSASSPLSGTETEALGFASSTLLPNLGIGWRRRRLAFGLDGQLYHDSSGKTYWNNFVGSNYALRLNVAYRLGHHPDENSPNSARQ